MILVDTSSWIHFLRPKGNEDVRKRVASALTEGEACWCPMVRLELWNAAQGQREGAVLRDLELGIAELAISVPATDILIAACALHHGASIETCDSDFDMLNSLRIGL